MSSPRHAAPKLGRKAKVIQVRVSDAEKIAEQIESALGEFLAKNPAAGILNMHMHMLDIGGPSQADILVVCTIIYAE